MKNITLYKNDFKIEVSREVLENRIFTPGEWLEFFDLAGYEFERYSYSNDLEGYKEACYDYLSTYIYDGLSIFNKDIMRAFGELDMCDIDDVVSEYGISYDYKNMDFNELARFVITELKFRDISEELEEIFEAITHIDFNEENFKEVK